MKVQFTYKVIVTVDEEDGAKVEAALEEAVKPFNGDVTETDAEEITDGDEG